MIFLRGPLRISAISALKRLFQRRDRGDTQRTAEKDSKTGKATSPFVQTHAEANTAGRRNKMLTHRFSTS